ncbi:MAG: DUF4956 domain-containing protein [Planctomycetota bacterium]
MPEWLTPGLSKNGEAADPAQLALLLGLAFCFGCVIAAIFRATHRAGPVPQTFPSTLVLLAILSAMVPPVIGDHVARAFGLVGALSIVRFRTVVEDTRDIVFVIFAVLVGMAVGANHLTVAIIGTVVTGSAAFLVRPKRFTPANWVESDANLTVRLGVGRRPDEVLAPMFAKYLTRFELQSAATGRQGAALDFTYQVRLRPDLRATDLVADLNQLDGVQNVELRRG